MNPEQGLATVFCFELFLNRAPSWRSKQVVVLFAVLASAMMLDKLGQCEKWRSNKQEAGQPHYSVKVLNSCFLHCRYRLQPYVVHEFPWSLRGSVYREVTSRTSLQQQRRALSSCSSAHMVGLATTHDRRSSQAYRTCRAAQTLELSAAWPPTAG